MCSGPAVLAVPHSWILQHQGLQVLWMFMKSAMYLFLQLLKFASMLNEKF